ncbi:PAQR family membrane homeostasis protein TrhA [Terrarubrum flagellatum]|uniref:PAQR family membrane homeostasis protein TrhA n=1 Tax=Terrirubrum flagellatum TaxID=2895980 RepID=UPI0031456AB0
MSLPAGHPRLSKRPYGMDELFADGLIHAFALLAAVVGLAVLLLLVIMRRTGAEASAVAIYGVALIAMFGFSAAYNLIPPSPLKWLLRRFDHSSIYLLIAGTYTPLLTQFHDQFWAWTLALVVWTGAIAGIVLKVAMPGKFDRLSIAIYLVLGWAAIVAVKPMLTSLPLPTTILLAIGGLLYSVGVLFYLWHKLKYQNAIWHSFVAGAAGCHYAAIAYCMTGAN